MRFVRFGVVGASGIVINTVALALVVSGLGVHYLVGLVVATQASTIWNFAFSDGWVFETGGRHYGRRSRFIQFWTMNNMALLARGPIVWAFTEVASMHYLVSNFASLAIIMVTRYGVSKRVIWQESPGTESPGTVAPDTESPGTVAPGTVAPDTESTGTVAPDTESTGTVAPDTESSGTVALLQPSPGAVVTDPAATDPAATTPRAPTPVPPAAPGDTSIKRDRLRRYLLRLSMVIAVGVPAVLLRVAHLDSLGFNSDEAVYAGQAASIAGDQVLVEYFPIFRAHPLLFQTALSLVYQSGVSPLAGRLLAAAFGVATVVVTYMIGRSLYGRRAGVLAALVLAVMPYHVVVTRQVLLDGPMVFFSTTALFLLVRFVQTHRPTWLYAFAAAIGLTILTNERSVVLLGGVYLFFALVPAVPIKFRQIVLSFVILSIAILPFPLSVFFSGKSTTGEQFLAWQLFRRANHGWLFYATNVPVAIGYATLIAAALGLILLRDRIGWPEILIGCWCIVPLAFFEIWPVKGFQYLLALAPPLAILAGRALAAIPDRIRLGRTRSVGNGIVRLLAVLVVVALAASSSWTRITPAGAGEQFLAGSGGVPGGREAGVWVDANIPEGAELLAIGPSMANIIQWYGDRKVYGLSVSPNPLHRNPVYEPIVNPDLLLRNGDLHYLIWDSYSASRSTFFSEKLLTFAERYHGRIIHEQFVEVTTENGDTIQQPVIIIYEVRP